MKDSVQQRIEAFERRSAAGRKSIVTRRRRYGVLACALGGRPSQFPHRAEAVLHATYAKHVLVRALRGRVVPRWEDIVYWASVEAAHHAGIHLETEQRV